MTPAAGILAAEIRASGPIPFRRFMEVALYHPEHGYYRRAAGRDPFGKEGDFFTAEQVQPVFGILIASTIRALFDSLGSPPGFTVVELGAGRREMANAFSEWNYVPVDIDSGALPERFTGIVFSNEFFDALPVDSVICKEGIFHEQLVGFRNNEFVWETGAPVSEESNAYLRRYFPPAEDGRVYEVGLEALWWQVKWRDKCALLSSFRCSHMAEPPWLRDRK